MDFMTLYHITKRFSFYWAAREGKAQSTNEKQHSFYVKKIQNGRWFSQKALHVPRPGAPLTYFNDGGGPKDFFGSDILAKRDFFGVYESRRDFFGSRKQHRDFSGYCIFHQLKSTIT